MCIALLHSQVPLFLHVYASDKLKDRCGRTRAPRPGVVVRCGSVGGGPRAFHRRATSTNMIKDMLTSQTHTQRGRRTNAHCRGENRATCPRSSVCAGAYAYTTCAGGAEAQAAHRSTPRSEILCLTVKSCKLSSTCQTLVSRVNSTSVDSHSIRDRARVADSATPGLT